MNSLRHIAILVFDGIHILDVTGPAAVFSAANDAAGFEAYQVHLLSAHGGPIITTARSRLPPTRLSHKLDAAAMAAR